MPTTTLPAVANTSPSTAGDAGDAIELVGEIDVAFDADVYEFEGRRGDRFMMTVNSLNGSCSDSDRWNGEVTLVDVDGNLIGRLRQHLDTWGCRDYPPWEIPRDESYRFVVESNGGTSKGVIGTGSYNITVARLQE
ncbi:MAG: hypothetical protein ACRBK7_10410 [Acidimicrobiales bacterium]